LQGRRGIYSRLARDEEPPQSLVHLISRLKHFKFGPTMEDSIDPALTSLNPESPSSRPVPQGRNIKTRGRPSGVECESGKGG